MLCKDSRWRWFCGTFELSFHMSILAFNVPKVHSLALRWSLALFLSILSTVTRMYPLISNIDASNSGDSASSCFLSSISLAFVSIIVLRSSAMTFSNFPRPIIKPAIRANGPMLRPVKNATETPKFIIISQYIITIHNSCHRFNFDFSNKVLYSFLILPVDVTVANPQKNSVINAGK